MNVEISPDIQETAAQLGEGVPYALKVVAGQLAEDPDRGRPSALPGILMVIVDGDLFEDCPSLSVGYIREPDRVEIRYLQVVAAAEPSAGGEEPAHHGACVDGAVAQREVVDAWERITSWLRRSAPASFQALRPGADSAAIGVVEGGLGIQVPAALRTLWSLSGGDDGVNGGGCLPGNQALMPLDAVAGVYRLKMGAQAHEDSLNARRPEHERSTVWKATWIPVISYGAADRTSGLYVDAVSGYMGRWSRFNEGPGDELDTLVTYLEDVADMLEAPALATRDTPGLIGGALVWGSRLDSAQEAQWQPVAD